MLCCAAGAPALALALALPSSVVAQDPGSWWPGAGFALDLPAGWVVEKDVPDRGSVLQPPEADAPPVEIVTWRVSIGIRSAEDAAAEHERILAAQMRYRRTRLEAFRCPGAGEGVLVEGAAVTADGEEVSSAFVAFIRGTQAYAIGLFAEAGKVEDARTECLDPLLQRFTLAGTAPPPDEPPTGITPARPRPEVAARQAYTDPAGFSLSLPTGWRCVTSYGIIKVSSDGGATVFIVPVVGSDGPPGRIDVEDLVARCLRTVDGVRLVTSRQEAPTEGATWLRVSADGGRTEGLFSLTTQEQSGLLAGVVAPSDQMNGLLPIAAEVAGSFRADLPSKGLSDAELRTARWTDVQGSLVAERPERWMLNGGVTLYDNRPVISLEGRAVDGTAWFTWRQPVRPIFRELTEAMRALGFRDGDPYYAYDGVDPRMVMTRGWGSEVAVRNLLPHALTSLGAESAVIDEQPIPNLPLLGRAGEGVSLIGLAAATGLADGAGWFVVSQATIGEARDGWFWEASGLGFGGAPGRWAEAARALDAVVRSTAVSANADGNTRAALEPLIVRSRTALGTPAWRELVGAEGLTLALSANEGTGGESRRFAAPEALVGAWRALASGPR